MYDQRILEAKRLLGEISAAAAAHEIGAARQQFLIGRLDKLSEKEQFLLRQATDFLLLSMTAKEASDLDFGGSGCNGMVWYRIFGVKQPMPDFGTYSITESDILLLNLLLPAQRQELWEKRNLNFSYQLIRPGGNLRYRATVYIEMDHVALTLRRIQTEIRPFQSLGLSRQVARLMSLEYQRRGLILITGVSGSGKSTTLDTIVDANNRHSHGQIIMISDPIEHVHVSQKCVIRQREVSRDVLNFHDGVVQALRQDPDIIVIGELRDTDTFTAVLEAADSGHKVFATLHTSSAVESIDRILGETPPLEQPRIRERLAGLLTCVISQKLVRGLDGKLVLAKEVMVANGAIRSAIRNQNIDDIYQIIQQGNADGMVTMEQDLIRLYDSGIISREEAINQANNKKRLDELFRYHQKIA